MDWYKTYLSKVCGGNKVSIFKSMHSLLKSDTKGIKIYTIQNREKPSFLGNKYAKDNWILLTVLMRQLKAKEVFGNAVHFLNTCLFSSYFTENKYVKEDNSI